MKLKTRKTSKGQVEVLDPLRGRYVIMTPEEEVRQTFTQYLIEVKHFPPGLIAQEVSIPLNGTTRRADGVLYRQDNRKPRVIMEYKAPNIKITQDVFQQILSYNSVLQADYLIVTNGITTFVCKVDYSSGSAKFLREIPDYKEL